RNIWQSKADALASAAYYLKKSGWKAGKGWGGEVVLPKGFDLSFISTSIKKPLAEWERLGVAPIGSLENIGRAYLYLPAGLRGPVFLLGENFRAILRYNHSHAYGIGVGQLASVLGGGPHFSTDWPDSEAATLRLQEVEELQSLLTKKGFDTKGVDGRVGPATLAAVRNYQKAKGLIADGYIDKALLAHLRGR
ncbi:MAG: lytic murein transglycosylase, partial [Parvibaculales bacterium]